jgi:uncharacterized cupredoxin-like copper-binding protein
MRLATSGVLGTVIAALVLAGCQRAAQQPAPQAGGASAQVVHVVAREFAFDPRDIQVQAGMIRFVVRNDGAVEHDFEIVGVAQHGAGHERRLIRPGAVDEIEVRLRPGRYQVVCNVPGHRDAGMVGTITAL